MFVAVSRECQEIKSASALSTFCHWTSRVWSAWWWCTESASAGASSGCPGCWTQNHMQRVEKQMSTASTSHIFCHSHRVRRKVTAYTTIPSWCSSTNKTLKWKLIEGKWSEARKRWKKEVEWPQTTWHVHPTGKNRKIPPAGILSLRATRQRKMGSLSLRCLEVHGLEWGRKNVVFMNENARTGSLHGWSKRPSSLCKPAIDARHKPWDSSFGNEKASRSAAFPSRLTWDCRISD